MKGKVRKAVVIVTGAYVLWLMFAYRYHFLDAVNLLVHEAGHVAFGLFGELPGVLGGTLLQLLFPLLFVHYFWNRGQRFEASLCGVWLGESGMYTARYIADAQALELPLLGGGFHDWNWLLSRAGLLEWSNELGLLVHMLFSIVAMLSVWKMAREAFAPGGP